MLGPLDGPYGGLPRAPEAEGARLPTPEELLGEQLLHDANLARRSGIPRWVWVIVALAIVTVLVVLLGS